MKGQQNVPMVASSGQNFFLIYWSRYHHFSDVDFIRGRSISFRGLSFCNFFSIA